MRKNVAMFRTTLFIFIKSISRVQYFTSSSLSFYLFDIMDYFVLVDFLIIYGTCMKEFFSWMIPDTIPQL